MKEITSNTTVYETEKEGVIGQSLKQQTFIY